MHSRADTHEIASFCFTIWASIFPFHLPPPPIPSPSLSFILSISPFRTSSFFSFSGREMNGGEVRDRSGLAGSPDTFIGGHSTYKAVRPTRAGGSKAPAKPGRSRTRVVSTGSVNSRAHHSKVLPGEEGDPVLSRGSSVSVAGNGPTHRFAQPRRTPLARSDLRRSYGADATRPTAIFLLIFSPYISLPLPFSLSSSFLPSLPFFVSVYPRGLCARASSHPGGRHGGPIPHDAGDFPGKRTWGADKVREVPGEIPR